VPDWDAMALVGRVARAHGIRGQVIVNPETDFPGERFHPGAELFVNRSGRAEPITITTVRFHQGRPVIGLLGVEDMNAATGLAGAELRVPVDRLASLPADTFYRHDLIGCAVETKAGRHIGRVEDVEGTMAGSRLVVTAEGGGELLVPLAAEICIAIDPAAKRIVIDPPAGLLELNTKGSQKDVKSEV
jgi:16S rRNA processing protein RimM